LEADIPLRKVSTPRVRSRLSNSSEAVFFVGIPSKNLRVPTFDLILSGVKIDSGILLLNPGVVSFAKRVGVKSALITTTTVANETRLKISLFRIMVGLLSGVLIPLCIILDSGDS
jgi:hypothetical protein